MTKNSSARRGLSPLIVLAFIFITLKLTGHISWSWWWVLSPLWGGVLATPVVLFALIFYVEYKKAKSNA